LALNPNIIERWRKSDILLIGGSAGSFKPIFTIVQSIPSDLAKAVLIIIHRKKNYLSDIENLFAENSRMLLQEVNDKDCINKQTIYIAPANYHTLIEREKCFGLDVSEAIWYSKPSIDVSFESAAEIYKDCCTAILFSGANQDGAEGLLKLRKSGSLTIVQDPKEVEMPDMPQSAININAAEYVLSLNDILQLIKM
jgi:two-component system chemotaxis response regulator CheB